MSQMSLCGRGGSQQHGCNSLPLGERVWFIYEMWFFSSGWGTEAPRRLTLLSKGCPAWMPLNQIDWGMTGCCETGNSQTVMANDFIPSSFTHKLQLARGPLIFCGINITAFYWCKKNDMGFNEAISLTNDTAFCVLMAYKKYAWLNE